LLKTTVNIHRTNQTNILCIKFVETKGIIRIRKSKKNRQHIGTKEEFVDTKGVIRIRQSKKNRQHNGQKKKDKRTNNDLQNIHIKLKIE